jgi:hypothetical protein
MVFRFSIAHRRGRAMIAPKALICPTTHPTYATATIEAIGVQFNGPRKIEGLHRRRLPSASGGLVDDDVHPSHRHDPGIVVQQSALGGSLPLGRGLQIAALFDHS